SGRRKKKRGGGGGECGRPAERVGGPQPHSVVAAVGLEADAEVVEHLGECERDHDEVHAAGPERDRADHQGYQRRRRDGEAELDESVRDAVIGGRSEEHTSELQSLTNIVCRLLLEKKKTY